MAKYNGHKNWNHWNVSLWINNDQGLYNMALVHIRRSRNKNDAALNMLQDLELMDNDLKTPDGAPYSFSSIHAAMAGM